MLYRNEGELIQAGDRAPGGPNLVLAPTSTQDILHGLGKYNKDGDGLVDLYLVLPENTVHLMRVQGECAWCARRYTQGHVWIQRAYDVDATQARKASPSVIIISPDTY
ncbi:hypothetical protein BS47DRAFT_1356068, partial [Hydnum rufescens UP504]